MKQSLLCTALLCTIAAIAGCSSSSEVVETSESPTIRRVSSDTAYAGTGVYVYGTHLEYCSAWIGSTPILYHDSLQSNAMPIWIPLNATSDYIYVSKDGVHKVQSPKKIIVVGDPNQFFVQGGAIDRGHPGTRVTLRGTHFPPKDSLYLLYNNLFLAIDSVYPDSLIFHIPLDAKTGTWQLIYHNMVYASGGFEVTVPVVWRHATIKIIGYEYTANVHQSGFRDYSDAFDTTWSEHRTLDWQREFKLENTEIGTQQVIGRISAAATPNAQFSGFLSVSWDSDVHLYFSYAGAQTSIIPIAFTNDTNFEFRVNQRASLDPSTPVTVVFPLAALTSPVINYYHDESDHYGEHAWKQSTGFAPDPTYDVGRLVLELTP